MIASHPNIATAVLVIFASVCHFGQSVNSPMEYKSDFEISRHVPKENYDPSYWFIYRLFTALKWVSIGAAMTIQVIR